MRLIQRQKAKDESLSKHAGSLKSAVPSVNTRFKSKLLKSLINYFCWDPVTKIYPSNMVTIK